MSRHLVNVPQGQYRRLLQRCELYVGLVRLILALIPHRLRNSVRMPFRQQVIQQIVHP